jgi:hypothetical protein
MVDESTAEVLRDKLTEQGLVRELARQDISPRLIHMRSIEEAARALEKGIEHPSVTPELAKKVKNAKKANKVTHKASTKKSSGTKPPSTRRVQPRYWTRVQKELHILICTNDPKYASLRRQLNKSGSAAQTTIVSNIAAAVAVSLGYTVGALLPFVVIALIAFLRLGANAWCAGQAPAT